MTKDELYRRLPGPVAKAMESTLRDQPWVTKMVEDYEAMDPVAQSEVVEFFMQPDCISDPDAAEKRWREC